MHAKVQQLSDQLVSVCRCKIPTITKPMPLQMARAMLLPKEQSIGSNFSGLLQYKPSPATCGALQQQQYHRYRRSRTPASTIKPRERTIYKSPETICLKPGRFLVTHESQHFYLSARLERLQPNRMNDFGTSSAFQNAAFPKLVIKE